jgi:hypothetical protein
MYRHLRLSYESLCDQTDRPQNLPRPVEFQYCPKFELGILQQEVSYRFLQANLTYPSLVEQSGVEPLSATFIRLDHTIVKVFIQ